MVNLLLRSYGVGNLISNNFQLVIITFNNLCFVSNPAFVTRMTQTELVAVEERNAAIQVKKLGEMRERFKKLEERF